MEPYFLCFASASAVTSLNISTAANTVLIEAEARYSSLEQLPISMISEDNKSPEMNQVNATPFLKIEYADLVLNECCGAGSFGTVYCGEWISQKKCVAVKVVSHLDEEVNILSTLRHSNIIKFYGACCERPNFCIVSEYAPHGSLYSFLSSSSDTDLMFTQMLRWAKDVALGMKYLHEDAPIQVVHRDLKSKNILIGDDFCLKICDFGSSRVFDETVVMTFAGTYPWMAPELIQGLPTSTLCDVYSFGIVLWEILTREMPFKGLQGFQVAWIVVENHERPIIPSSCPQRLSNLIQQCWQGDPSFRPSFTEVLEILGSILMDEDAARETNTFTQNRSKWVEEVATKMSVIKKNEIEMWAENTAAENRNAIIKRWTQDMSKELKKHSISRYRFESFHRSVSFSDESQVTVENKVSDTVAAKNTMVKRNDVQAKSSSIVGHQKSFLSNVSHVSEEDRSLKLDLSRGKQMQSRSIKHDGKMKKQRSLGSLEFTGVSDSERVTSYRRLASTPICSDTIVVSDMPVHKTVPDAISVDISPAVIFKAIASSVDMSHGDLSYLAREVYKSIMQMNADSCDVATDANMSKVRHKLKICDAICADEGAPIVSNREKSVDVESQTIITLSKEVATQTPIDVYTSHSAGRTQEAVFDDMDHQSFSNEVCAVQNRLQDSTLDVCAGRRHTLHAWAAAEGVNFSGSIHKESGSVGWKRKKSLLRNSSLSKQSFK